MRQICFMRLRQGSGAATSRCPTTPATFCCHKLPPAASLCRPCRSCRKGDPCHLGGPCSQDRQFHPARSTPPTLTHRFTLRETPPRAPFPATSSPLPTPSEPTTPAAPRPMSSIPAMAPSLMLSATATDSSIRSPYLPP